MEAEPKLEVGIMANKNIRFLLDDDYMMEEVLFRSGIYEASSDGADICLKNETGETLVMNSFELTPVNQKSSFELKDVTIGIGFHWEQSENQKFNGTLKLVKDGELVRAINIVGLESYLKSVISSEMSATSSKELLKAHAVISRSWLLAQIRSKNNKTAPKTEATTNDEEIIRWYDREDHQLFDVCADDHCQRYQGITKIITAQAYEAVEQTHGEVLWSDNEICDARFSKCCGGLTENFENVWEPVRHRYLTKVVDSEFGDTTCVDLRQEDEAELWIRNKPAAFCNTSDGSILSQVLPGFDQVTTDFYRWKVEYSQAELAGLIHARSGIDFGEIVKLEPLKRGHSSRIIRLKITGTRKTVVVGKELEIRKWLSKSHLYSSAFVADLLDIHDGIPQKIVLTGAGWGHGVGLCQIGAAVMGENGYSYSEILSHYFKGAVLKKLYQ